LYSSLFLRMSPFCFSILRPVPRSTLFPYTTLFRSNRYRIINHPGALLDCADAEYGDLRLIDYRRAYQPAIYAGVGDCECAALNRSEEHTSELQSPYDLVCRLLLEKKKITATHKTTT